MLWLLYVLTLASGLSVIASPVGKEPFNLFEGSSLTKIPGDQNKILQEACGLQKKFRRMNMEGYASVGEYPWTVVILSDIIPTKNTVKCAGTLISGRHVLTAAHCLASRNKKLANKSQPSWFVGVGGVCNFRERQCDVTYNIEKLSEIVKVKAAATFDRFFSESYKYGQGDMAIIELEKEVWNESHTNGSVLPACLSRLNLANPQQTLTVTGYGSKGYTSEILMAHNTAIANGNSFDKTAGTDCVFTNVAKTPGKKGQQVASGGSGLLSKLNGRWFVIGSHSGGDDKVVCNTNLACYTKNICAMTGVCP